MVVFAIAALIIGVGLGFVLVGPVATAEEVDGLAVTGIDAPNTVGQHDTFDVTVTVTNTKDEIVTQDLILGLEGAEEELAAEMISLDDGETITHTFTNVSIDEAGLLTLVAETEDDTGDRLIEVEETLAERSLSTDVVTPGATVQATITGEFDESGNYTVTESFDGSVSNIEIVDDGGAESVSIGPDDELLTADFEDTDAVSLTYRVTMSSNAEIGETLAIDGEIEGESRTDVVATDTIEVADTAGVAITDVELSETAVAGEPVAVNVSVEHLEGTEGQSTIELSEDGSIAADETVALDPFERETITLEWTPTTSGELELTASTETHEHAESHEVLEPAAFEVSDLDAPSPVTQFEPFEATLTVENTGGASATKPVELTLDDGTVLAETNVTLAGGESTTVVFDELTIEEPSVHTLVVTSGESTTDRPIEVVPTTAHRELSSDVVEPGGTVQVTVSATLESEQDVTLEETIGAGVGEIEVVDDGGASITVDDGEITAEYTDQSSVTLVYRLTVDEGMVVGDTIDLDGTVTGDDLLPTGTDTITIDDDPGVAVLDLDTPATAIADNETSVTATLENLGSETTTVTVTYTVDNDTVVTETVTLDGFEQTTVEFDWTPTSDDIGLVAVDVATETHNESATVEVLAPTHFAVNELSAPSLVTQFEPFDIEVTVENTGDVASTESIELVLDTGEVLATTEEHLAAGESTTVTFENVSVDTTGQFDATVTAATEASWELVVEPAPASVTVPDQVIGERTDGTPAAYLEGVSADAGWTAIVVDDGTVLGVEEIEDDIDDARVIVDLPGYEDAGVSIARIVATDQPIEVGEPLSADAHILDTDVGLLGEAALSVDDQTYDDGTDSVVIDVADIVGDGETAPYVVAIYHDTGDSLERIGSSSTLEDGVEGLVVDLDEPIDDAGVHDLVVRLEGPLGMPDEQVFETVVGDTVEPVATSLSVEIVDVPSFSVGSVEVDEPVAPGDVATVTVEVTNAGVVDGSATVWADMGAGVVLQDVVVGAEGNETVTLSVPVPETSGDQAVLIVDVGDESVERTVPLEDGDADSTDDGVPGFGIGLAVLGLLTLAVAVSRLRT